MINLQCKKIRNVPFKTQSTERRGRVENTCFVLGRSRIQILVRRPAIVTDFFCLSEVPLGKFWDRTLNLGQDPFFPQPFKFIVHL